jgi:hypothetical protein
MTVRHTRGKRWTDCDSGPGVGLQSCHRPLFKRPISLFLSYTVMAEDSESYAGRRGGGAGGGGNGSLHLPIENLKEKISGIRYASITPDYNFDDWWSSEQPDCHHQYVCPEFWQLWWLVVPEEYFVSGAKTFSDMLYKEHPDVVEKYQLMLQIMLRVAELIDLRVGNPVCVLVCDRIPAEGSVIDNPSTHKFSGVRYRLAAPGGATYDLDFGKIVQDIINTNQADKRKRGSVVKGDCLPKGRGRDGDRRPAYTSLTRESWHHMAAAITARTFAPGMIASVTDLESDFHPANLYGMQQYNKIATRGLKTPCHNDWHNWSGLAKMKDQQLRTPGAGSKNVLAYVFPADGLLAWKISLETFTPETFRGTFFPWVNPSSDNGIAVSSTARDAFVQRACPDRDLMAEDDPDDLRALPPTMTQEEAKRYYDNHINRTAVDDTPLTLDKVAAICKRTMQSTKDRCKAEGHHPGDDYTREAVVKTTLEGIDFYEKTMMHQDAVLSPSGKAIVKWRKEFLQNHRQLSMPRPNHHANLSSFGNLITGMMESLEGLGGANVMHLEVIILFLSACYASSGDIEQINVLFSGPAATSKSWVLALMRKLLVDGTIRESSYTTAAAYTASGDDSKDPASHLIHDGMCIVNDELRPTELGISTGPGGRDSGTSDAASMLKSMLTGGYMVVQSMKWDEKGDRVAVSKKIPVRSPHWYAFNFPLTLIEPALRSRFLCIQVESLDRTDTDGLLALTSSEASGERKMAWDLIVGRFQLHQARAHAVWDYIQCGFLPDVSMDVVMNTVVDATLKEGATSGMDNCSDKRRKKLLVRFIKQLVILDAVDKVFDAPMSRLKFYDFSPHHYLELAPHLVAQTRHVAFAFGLMKDSFEDNVGRKIREKVCEYVNQNKDVVVISNPVANKRNSSGDPVLASYLPPIADVRGSRVEVVASSAPVDPYIKCSARKLFGVNPSRPLVEADMISRLATEVLTTMSQKPLDGTVQAVIKRMTETAQLELSMEYLRIPRNRGNASVTIKSILEYRLNHRHARRQDLLYGKSHVPFLLDVITVHPGNAYRRWMIYRRQTFGSQIDAGIGALVCEADQMAREPAPPLRLSPIEYPHAQTGVATDVDTMAIEYHNIACGRFSPVQLAEPPTANVFEEMDRDWAFMDRYHPRSLPYPICFPQWFLDRYVLYQKCKRRKMETAAYLPAHQTSMYLLQFEEEKRCREQDQAADAITAEERAAMIEQQRAKQRALFVLDQVKQVRFDYIRPVPLPDKITVTNRVYHLDPPVRRFLSEFDDITTPRYEDEEYGEAVDQSEREYAQESRVDIPAETDDEDEGEEGMQE